MLGLLFLNRVLNLVGFSGFATFIWVISFGVADGTCFRPAGDVFMFAITSLGLP